MSNSPIPSTLNFFAFWELLLVGRPEAHCLTVAFVGDLASNLTKLEIGVI